MTVTIITMIVQLLAGAGAGNLLANARPKFDLGPAGNSIAGAIGGLGGGVILDALTSGLPVAAGSTGGLDTGMLLTHSLAGAIGGALLTALVALIRRAMSSGRAA